VWWCRASVKNKSKVCLGKANELAQILNMREAYLRLKGKNVCKHSSLIIGPTILATMPFSYYEVIKNSKTY